MARWLLLAVLACAAVGPIAVVQGCSGDLTADCYNPKSDAYNMPGCVQARANDVDAGADGADGSDGSESSDGSSSARACECVPNPPNHFHAPQPFWIGESNKDAPDHCPPEIGAFGALQFADLHVPTPGCPKCVCGEIKGTCSPTPTTISIRAGTCNEPQAYTTNFNVPVGWDGSCTNDKALPAGAECPPGSGIPCAQSIYVSAFPDPIEGCEVVPPPSPSAKDENQVQEKPTGGPSSSNTDLPWWGQVALSCSASSPGPDSECGLDSLTCRSKLPEGWRHCVRHEDPGIHECEVNSEYTERFITYPDDAKIDNRICTACGCKASGGLCYGTFSVFEDDACTVPVTTDGLGSITYDCNDVIPAGRAIGSKSMTNIEYVPGKCQPTGGVAIGTVELDETKAETWCCWVPKT